MGRESARKVIICLSHLTWDRKLFQRPQQLMLQLSKRFNVLYVNDHSFFRFITDMFSKEKNFNLNINSSLTVYTPFGLPSRFKKLSLFTQLNKMLSPFLVRRKLRKLKFADTILWIYHPRYLYMIKKLEADLVIYDCMDDYTSLSFRDKDREKLTLYERDLLKRADIVFVGGYSIAELKMHVRNDIHVFPSAVEINHFKRAFSSDIEVPNDIKDIPHPILGYWGAIDERIDHQLLASLALKNPDWHIVLLGPIVKLQPRELPYLREMKNITWLGPKDYTILPSYAKVFDVCLMPFVLTIEGRYLSPTKTLEYLATGKPVISTPIPDVVRFFDGVVTVAEGVDDFGRAVRRCLAEDNVHMRHKRIAFTEGKTWENTAAMMEQLLLAAIEKRNTI